MNNRTAKKLRKAIGDITNPITRRVYRRVKKQYNKIPQDSRGIFIEMTRETLNGKK
jgi:hypothetical protein